MAITLGNADVNLTAAAQTIFQVGPSAQAAVLQATATNLDTVSHWITVWRVPSSGSTNPGDICGADQKAIGAGATIAIPIRGQTLVREQFLVAACDADNMVNINLSYAVVA